MMNYLIPLITGMLCGVVFTIFKLPIPAPPSIYGIIGIFGVYLGYILTHYFQ